MITNAIIQHTDRTTDRLSDRQTGLIT